MFDCTDEFALCEAQLNAASFEMRVATFDEATLPANDAPRALKDASGGIFVSVDIEFILFVV